MISVLVVEDDEKLNYIVSNKLSEEGYEVFHCGNPLQASWTVIKLMWLSQIL